MARTILGLPGRERSPSVPRTVIPSEVEEPQTSSEKKHHSGTPGGRSLPRLLLRFALCLALLLHAPAADTDLGKEGIAAPGTTQLGNIGLNIVGSAAVAGDAVDIVFTQTGASASLITAAELNAGVIGTTASNYVWALSNHSPATHTKLNDYTTTYQRRTPFTCNGTSYDGSTSSQCQFDITLAKSNALSPLYEGHTNTLTVGTANGCTLSGLTLYGVAVGSADVTYDNYIIYPGAGYSAHQYAVTTSPAAQLLRIEGQVSAVTNRGQDITIPSTSTVYAWDQYVDVTNHRTCLALVDNATNIILGVSEANTDTGTLTSIVRQSYLASANSGNGSIIHGIAGLQVVTPVFPLPSRTLPAPTAVSPSQTAISQVTVTWSGVSQRYKVERSSNGGSSYSTLNATYDLGQPGVRSYVDSTVSDLTTYTYRISAICGTLTTASSTVNSVSVNNATFPVALDTFESYPDGLTDMNGLGNWVGAAAAAYELKSGSIHVYTGAVNRGFTRNTATVNANMRVECILGAQADPAYGLEVGPGARISSARTDGYYVSFLYVSGAKKLRVGKRNGGTDAQIGTDYATTITTGDKFSLDVSGTGSATRLKVQVYQSGVWTDIATGIDPGGTYIDGGSAGLYNRAQFGQDSTIQIDDWRVFNLGILFGLGDALPATRSRATRRSRPIRSRATKRDARDDLALRRVHRRLCPAA